MASGAHLQRPAVAALLLAALAHPLGAQDAVDTVADTVRDRGHPCAQAIAAERDEAASRPDEAVWILTCSDARYRVRFPGDTAPQVERLDP
jgi:hypothetical protein